MEPIHNVPLALRRDTHLNIFSKSDIAAALAKLRNNKAADQHDIKAEYLKALHKSEFPRVMADIFNKIQKSGTFLKTWSEAEARPLHKQGPMDIKDNYRYIMITSLFYKLYAMTINDKITPCL